MLTTIARLADKDGNETLELQVDERNRLHIDGKRIATSVDLGEARLPVWIGVISAALAALGTWAQAIPAWISLCPF